MLGLVQSVTKMANFNHQRIKSVNVKKVIGLTIKIVSHAIKKFPAVRHAAKMEKHVNNAPTLTKY